jgi:phenylacetate-CoA ligase
MIEKAFGCPVANEYGAHDGAAVIAHECPEGRMHIASDQVYLESVNGSRNVPLGETGDVLVTNLESYGMPFIKYKIGDTGALSDAKCQCGLGFPIMKIVTGRVNDFIVLRNGKRIHASFLNSIMMKQDNLDRFKAVQHSLGNLEIMVSLRKESGYLNEEKIRKQICSQLGTESITLTFKYVTDIPPELSGKFLYFVSRLGETDSTIQEIRSPAEH